MLRPVRHPENFTPTGLWIRDHLSPHMGVTNLDYVLHRQQGNRHLVQMIEEKRYRARLTPSQERTFRLLDEILKGYPYVDYWGFHLLQLKKELPEDGAWLNGQPITVAELIKQGNFERPDTPGYFDVQAQARRAGHGATSVQPVQIVAPGQSYGLVGPSDATSRSQP